MGRWQLVGVLALIAAGCSSNHGTDGADAAAGVHADANVDADAGAGSDDGGSAADARASADAAPLCATDCSELGGPCVVGVCNASGKCEAQTAADTTSCDDGNVCSTGATCTAGQCGGGTLTCDVPIGLTTATPAATPTIGTAASTTDDLCADGQVLVGMYGSHYPSRSQPTLFEWFQSAGAICAPITWVWDVATTRYLGQTGATTDLTEVGQHYALADWRRQCPDGAVIVGVTATVYSGVLTKMTFSCAPLTAVYDTGNWTLDVGAATGLTQVGLGLGTDVSTSCSSGEIAAGVRIGLNGAGTSASSLAFLCGAPSLVLGQ